MDDYDNSLNYILVMFVSKFERGFGYYQKRVTVWSS